jgi:hypothetical protein
MCVGALMASHANIQSSSVSQAAVHRKLDDFLQEYREGKREGSVISTHTMDTICTNDKQVWRTIRKELEDIGISVAAFDNNKEFIFEWFLNAVRCGAFEERPWDDSSSTELYEDSSDEALKGNLISLSGNMTLNDLDSSLQIRTVPRKNCSCLGPNHRCLPPGWHPQARAQ